MNWRKLIAEIASSGVDLDDVARIGTGNCEGIEILFFAHEPATDRFLICGTEPLYTENDVNKAYSEGRDDEREEQEKNGR